MGRSELTRYALWAPAPGVTHHVMLALVPSHMARRLMLALWCAWEYVCACVVRLGEGRCARVTRGFGVPKAPLRLAATRPPPHLHLSAV